MVSASRHLMGNAPEQRGVRGGWQWGSLVQCWNGGWLLGILGILALERNTSEGRSSKATGCPGLQPLSSVQD